MNILCNYEYKCFNGVSKINEELGYNMKTFGILTAYKIIYLLSILYICMSIIF